MLINIMLIKKSCDQTRKRERQISEMNMTLGKYGL